MIVAPRSGTFVSMSLVRGLSLAPDPRSPRQTMQVSDMPAMIFDADQSEGR